MHLKPITAAFYIREAELGHMSSKFQLRVDQFIILSLYLPFDSHLIIGAEYSPNHPIMALPFEDLLMIASRPSNRLFSQSLQHPQGTNLDTQSVTLGLQVPSLSDPRLVPATRE